MKALVGLFLMGGAAGCDAGTIGPDPTGDGPSGAGSSGSGSASGEEHQGFEQGSRLKVRALVAEDGAQQRVGFRDTMRNESCFFQLASDGATRCLPSTSTTMSPYFSDSTCTTRLAMAPAGCTPTDAYVVDFDASTCGAPSPVHIYQRGAPHAGAVYQLAGSCINATPSVPLFLVDGEIAPSSFVAATEMVVP